MSGVNGEVRYWGLVATLCVLGVVIVGLAVGNVVVMMQEGDGEVRVEEVVLEEEIDLPDNPYEEGTPDYYRFLIREIVEEDTERLMGEEAIRYAIMVDEAEKSIDSAGLVISTASQYDLNDIVDEYLEIYASRMRENMEYSEGGIG